MPLTCRVSAVSPDWLMKTHMSSLKIGPCRSIRSEATSRVTGTSVNSSTACSGVAKFDPLTSAGELLHVSAQSNRDRQPAMSATCGFLHDSQERLLTVSDLVARSVALRSLHLTWPAHVGLLLDETTAGQCMLHLMQALIACQSSRSQALSQRQGNSFSKAYAAAETGTT